MLKALLIALTIIALSVILLAVRLLFGKRTFIHTHIEGNKALHTRGIHCAKEMDTTLHPIGKGLNIQERT